MKKIFYQIKLINTKFLSSLILLTCISLSVQNQANATANEDKEQIIAMANWALINFPDLFFDSYNGPFTGFGYRYVCYVPSNNCIGINQQTGSVDVLINGVISTVGPVQTILALMANSQNGILNLSGDSVDNNTVPVIFSPGLGNASVRNGNIISISWTIQAIPAGNQGPDNPSETCDFSVIINIANPATVVNASFRRNITAGADLNQWDQFATSNAGFPGIIIDNENRTLTFTQDVTLPKITGGTDPLGIASGGTLRF